MALRHALVVLLWAAATTAAHAESFFRDSEYGFTILQPEGWTADSTVKEQHVRLTLKSPDASVTAALCNVTAVGIELTNGMTQPEINTKVDTGWISSSLTDEATSLDPNATVVSRDRVSLGDLRAERAEINFIYPAQDGGRMALSAFKLIVLIPGKAYNVNCLSRPEAYADERPIFDRILRSLTVTP